MGCYVWHQFVLQEHLKVGRVPIGLFVTEQPPAALGILYVDGYGQIIGISKVPYLRRYQVRRADANDDKVLTLVKGKKVG